MSGALFVVPIEIATGGSLTSTTAPSTGDPAAWSSGTTYALLATAKYGDSIYRSLQASNTNKNPETQPTWWVRIGATFAMRMFDQKVGSQTEAANQIQVVITPGELINVISLRNVVAATVNVVQETATEGEVFNRTIALDEPVADWLEYFFSEIVMKEEAVFTGLSQYTDAVYTITISNPGGVAKCGELLMGPALEPGPTQAGLSDGIDDYSIIAADEFGVRDIVERDFADNMDFSVIAEKARSSALKRLLTQNRARAILVIASDARPDAQVYGFAESWRRVLSYPDHDVFNITMRGLT